MKIIKCIPRIKENVKTSIIRFVRFFFLSADLWGDTAADIVGDASLERISGQPGGRHDRAGSDASVADVQRRVTGVAAREPLFPSNGTPGVSHGGWGDPTQRREVHDIGGS